MSNENESGKQPEVTKHFAYASDFRTVYTNWIEASYSPFDISLTLCESSMGDDGNIAIKRLVRVLMNPSEARVLTQMLQNVTGEYERVWGKIAQPEFQAEQSS